MMGGFCAHIQLLRGGELMLQRQCEGPVVVGSSGADALPIPFVGKNLSLLSPTRAGYTLQLPEGTRGKLKVGERVLRVAGGLLHDPRPEPLIFRDGDRGALFFSDGDLQLRFSVVQQLPSSWRPRVERGFVLALATAAVVMLGGASLITSFGGRAKKARHPLLLVRPAIVNRVLAMQKAHRSKTRQAHRPQQGRSLNRLARRPKAPRARRGPLVPTQARRSRRIAERLRVALKASERILTSSLQLSQMELPKAGLGALSSAGALRRALPKTAPVLLPTPKATGLPLVHSTRGSKLPSKKAIGSVVGRHRREIRLCYERTLLRHASPPQGRLLIRWRIGPSGKATQIRPVRKRLRLPSLERCIVERIRAWTFPPCDGATCEVIYPFEFLAQT